MRTTKDRIRHTIGFEVLLNAICIPLLSWVLGESMAHIGGFALMMCLAAMTWNYIYNVLFDHSLKALGRPLYPRSFALRAFHAIAFELGLLVVTVPAIMWWMNYTLLQALALDVAFVITVPIYAVIYNYAYDHLFPVVEEEPIFVKA